MIAQIAVEATGSNLGIYIDTHKLAKLFGSITSVNINSIQINPLTFGVAVDVLLYADKQVQRPEESPGGGYTFPAAQVGGTSEINGATGRVVNVQKPGFQTFFRITTVDVQPQRKAFSLFHIANNLLISWSADVDFVLEFDFTVLNEPWDWREELADLLAGKWQVQDPNVDNLDGKRQLVNNPLLRG